MKPLLIKKIIFDFFEGKSSSIQQKMIAEWLESSENEELYYEYLDEWESHHPQSEIDISKALGSVKNTIYSPISKENKPQQPYFRNSTSRFKIIWLAAASIVLLSWLGWFSLQQTDLVTYDKLVETSKTETGEIYEKENRTNEALVVNLPDGSSVLLQPLGKLSYSPNKFNKETREIILSGDAFFEVKKDKRKPFIVYSNSLITKVLGTSFTIKANPSTSKTEVFVKTGKVEVFTQDNKQKNEKLASKILEGLVLKQNQHIEVINGESLMFKPIDVKIEQLTLPIQKLTFSFEDASAVDVIEELKMAYHLPIIYNKELLSKCKITAHLSDEPLLEKLKLICFVIDATFEENDGEITIKSKGCI